MSIIVTRINITPVKGTRIETRRKVRLISDGVWENRRFYFIDRKGLMVNGKRTGELTKITSSYTCEDGRLVLDHMERGVVEGIVREFDEAVTTSFYGRPVSGRVIKGPWSGKVSEWVGENLRLVMVASGTTGTDVHPVTVVSNSSLKQLLEASDGPAKLWKDRFRMLFEVDGLEAFEEDTWVGRQIRIGEAVVTIVGPIPRCVVTQRDPVTGSINYKTLQVLKEVRGENTMKLSTPSSHLANGNKLLLGVYGTVSQYGEVAEGSAVSVLG